MTIVVCGNNTSYISSLYHNWCKFSNNFSDKNLSCQIDTNHNENNSCSSIATTTILGVKMSIEVDTLDNHSSGEWKVRCM